MEEIKRIAKELGVNIQDDGDNKYSLYRGTRSWSMYGSFNEEEMIAFLKAYRDVKHKSHPKK